MAQEIFRIFVSLIGLDSPNWVHRSLCLVGAVGWPPARADAGPVEPRSDERSRPNAAAGSLCFTLGVGDETPPRPHGDTKISSFASHRVRRSLAHRRPTDAAAPWPRPMARASRHRAPRRLLGPASPWDGSVPRLHSALLSGNHRRGGPGDRLGLRLAVTLELGPDAGEGCQWPIVVTANQTASFFLVSGFGSGAYSAKLLNGTRHRFSGFSQPRQCGDDLLRMFVTVVRPCAVEAAGRCVAERCLRCSGAEGCDLITATYAHIGPEVADTARRFARNNLACSNCHLAAGTKSLDCRCPACLNCFRNTVQGTALTGRTHGCSDHRRRREENPCPEPSTHGPKRPASMLALPSAAGGRPDVRAA
ncbi:hypothetical protein ACVWY5_006936 [Bradyrhizobium sp. USDA 3256]